MWNSLFSLLQISFMWRFQVKFSSSVTPRNFICEVLLISWLRNLILSGRLGTIFLRFKDLKNRLPDSFGLNFQKLSLLP